MKTGYVILCRMVRIALAAMFLWAGLSKLADPQAFADGIASFRFFPEFSINIMAMSAPIVELIAAGLLLTGRWSRQGGLLCLFLGVVFAFLFSWAGVRGLAVDCACFGSSSDAAVNPWWGIVRALLIVMAGGVVIAGPSRTDD